MSENKYPPIRIRGFRENWDDKSISQLYEKCIQKNDLTYGNKDIISVAKMHYAPNPLITSPEYLKTYNVFLPGDIAFEGNRSKNHAYGRFVENTIGPGIVSHVFKVYRPIVKYDLLYWKYAINEEKIMRPHLAVCTKSSTMMKELRDQDFLNEKLLVPKFEEQSKIGAILDTLDKLIEYYERTLPIYDQLIKSRFIEMFGNPFTNEKGWIMSILSDLGTLERGVSKHRPRNDPILLGGKYPLIQTGDVANSFTYIKKYTQTYSEVGLRQSKMWKKGTLCITIAANIANTSILSFDACFPDSIVGFVPNRNTDVLFIHYLFTFIQGGLERNAPQSAQKNINLDILKKLKVISPPLD